MDLGYQGKLFILAADHRTTLQRGMFGISGREPTALEQAHVRDAKTVVWEGFHRALNEGIPAGAAGLLVDEETAAGVARSAAAAGVLLAMPVERSGRDVFDYAFGADFGTHIEDFNPHLSKVLVRWNPADDPAVKRAQGERLAHLGAWLHARGRKYLFELLVPPTRRQLDLVGGSPAGFDAHLRPALVLEALGEIREAGVEPDVWKIEGLDTREGCALVSSLVRQGGRDEVKAVVLGRGADQARVEHWLRTAAGVPGYAGFAIGRTIWWDAVQRWKAGTLSREQAVATIARLYRHFVEVYEEAAASAARS
jgi:myo-inositol catabolism protein IolC